MREPPFSQKTRFIILLIEIGILCLASYVALGKIFPAGDDKGFWFYTALLGLVFGSRLDTPFFAAPADAVLYAVPAATALLLQSSWDKWGFGVRVAFVAALAYCAVACLFGGTAILSKDAKTDFWRRISNVSRILAESFGAPRTLFTIVIVFALYAFHRDSAREMFVIGLAWSITAFLSPLEESLRIVRRLRRVWSPNSLLDADGEIVAYQTPGIVLVRQLPKSALEPRRFVAIQDPVRKTRMAIVLDHVGRDDGMLLRLLEIPDFQFSPLLTAQLSSVEANAVVGIDLGNPAGEPNNLARIRDRLVGIVAPETSVELLLFEVVRDDGLQEGHLVEVEIAGRMVTYQIATGLTREDLVQQKNTFGYVRAQAHKIGIWDDATRQFNVAKWLPQPNAPVFSKTGLAFEPSVEAIGHFPGTNYGVSLRSTDALVTHNTAILGILGVGKSMLAIELVERMMVAGVKVVCIDLTNQYAQELSSYLDTAAEQTSTEHLKQTGRDGRVRVRQNVEDGGSRKEFAEAVATDITAFLASDRRLKIYSPAQFEVWRQDSRPFNNTASMASLSPAEITHIISDATLQACIALGMTDHARACLVYEEAHSLVPEWNSAVAEGDRTASNGSARAILQGRKYGLGCLLITQRTANVTKTILNQCNSVFAMRTFDETGKDFLANYLGREYADMLPSLQERHAIFFGRASSCENPVLIRVNDRSQFLQVFRAAHPPPPLPTIPPPTAAPSAQSLDEDIPF